MYTTNTSTFFLRRLLACIACIALYCFVLRHHSGSWTSSCGPEQAPGPERERDRERDRVPYIMSVFMLLKYGD